jgi:hypothetical protein
MGIRAETLRDNLDSLASLADRNGADQINARRLQDSNAFIKLIRS